MAHLSGGSTRFLSRESPGAETWSDPTSELIGGGAVWTPFSFDADNALVYVAVSNPAPDFYAEAREGDNLYTNSLVVLDARTGELQWHYQATPRELIGMPIRPPASIRETIQAAVLVAGVDLVAGLAGNAKLPAEAGHLLAVEQPGNESETFVHNMTLLPGHRSLPQREKVLPMSPE